MSHTRLSRWLALLTAILLPSSVAPAKGPPDKVVITGPGLPNQIVVTDHATLAALEFSALMDFESPAEAPSTRAGYTLTYYYLDSSGKSEPAFVMRYYPDSSGGAGRVYNRYAPNGPWLYAQPDGDSTMRQLLQAHGVAVTPSVGVLPTSRASVYATLVIVGVSVLIFLGTRLRLYHAKRIET